jgi:RHS repeat-associated protein
MKKYIFFFVLLPLFSFSQTITSSDLILTGSGGGSGNITVSNNVLTVTFSGSWSPQVMKTGIIKAINASPVLPDLDLGSIPNGNVLTGYNAKIENNNLVFYSPFFLSGINTTVSVPIPGGAAGVSASLTLPNLYSCVPSGGGGSSGSVTVSNGIATLYLSGGWSTTCNLRTGILATFSTVVPDVEFGILSDSNSNPTAYGARIAGNNLIIYLVGTMPAVPTGCGLIYSKDLSDYRVLSDSTNHWTHQVAYDSKGNVVGSSRTYFDDLGKSDVSLSKDYVTNKIWGTETTFDSFGRPDKSSFITPSDLSSFGKTQFFKTPAEILASALPVDQPVGAVTTSQTVKASNSITATAPISSGLNVNFIAGNTIVLGNGFSVTAVAGSSFAATIVVAPDASTNAKLSNYYSDNNTLEPYQATATQPYSQNNYDTLNPGNVINVVGGNKINGEWKTGYSYTVPAAQEMYYVYGADYYEGPITSGREEVITKFYKSVSVDANGVENVAFTDGEGKVLASARSGGAISYPVVSLIGTQGFVDVHIPAGITTGISLIGGASLYTVYNLKTGAVTTTITGGNAYRIQANTAPTTDPKTYILNGAPTYDPGALGIVYPVNYYDYAVNVYNKTGQLIKSIQPNGYVANSTIVAVPAHMTSPNFATTYFYNALGQVVGTTSPDEGTSKFAYRKDGQIRYSQSALQIDAKVSYTDYDTYGRPIESGVIATTWASAIVNPDASLVTGIRSEQTFTVYDLPENNTTSVTLPTTPSNLTLAGVLASAVIPIANYTQNNLSGNVAITYTKPGATITAITWYSYDIYGRTEWMVEYNEGIGAKTIHYYYDYKGNVKKVLYQKDKSTELFAHQYTYDANDVLKKVETSTDNSTFITHADYSYYLTGELKRVNIAQGLQGLDYVYTLGGQLKSINHPSLEAAKDPGGDTNDVFGLTLDYYNGDYLRTGRNITSSPSAGADYNGNIKAARWTNRGIAADMYGNVANQKGYLYNYDRNNWLTGATFGNTNSTTAAISPTGAYNEGSLTYDANGNIKTLQRTNSSGTLQDNLTYNYNIIYKNQLNYVADAVEASTNVNDIGTQSQNNYTYDAVGQMTRNNQEDINYFYNTQGLVTQVSKGANAVVKFFYNERGQRIKKESYNTISPYTINSTDYYILDLSGNVMSIYNKTGSSSIVQKDLPIFGLGRLGVYNRATATSTYEITDHLGNVRAVVQKENGIPVIKSFADYYPFGEKFPGDRSVNNGYRYAFQGQEKDGETEMEAFQLRLWDGRIGRWLSPDPMGQYASPYLGMGNNPVGSIDPDGGYSWAGAFIRWAGGGFEGTMHKSVEYGDWGINKASNNTTFDTGDGGVGIQFNTDYGSKRIDFNNRDFNFGGAGAGGMSLFGANVKINDISPKYVGNHKGVDEYEWAFATNGAFTPGPFVVYPIGGSKRKYYNVHEPGHVLQYRQLGLFNYWRKVAIPSLIYATFHNVKEASRYHTETQANRLWYLKTGESDEINNPFSAEPIPSLNIK